MKPSIKVVVFAVAGLIIFTSAIALACHELTARDRTFWQEMYGKPKTFLFPFKPIPISVSSEKARNLNDEGIKIFTKGIYPDAEEYFLQSAELEPKTAAIYHNLALISYTQLKLNRAQTLWRKASSLDPGNPRYHYHLAAAYSHDGKVDEAIAEYNTTLKLTSGSPELYNSIGQLYEFKDDHDMAIKSFEKALALNPYYKESLQNIARIYFSTGQHKKSEAVYLKMLEIDANDVELFISLGKNYSLLGEKKLAVKYFTEAVKKRMDYPYPRFLLAKALEKVGDNKRAAKMKKLALSIRQDNYIGCIVDPTADYSVPTIQVLNDLQKIP